MDEEMDEMDRTAGPGDDQLERRLAAFAEARLTPSDDAVARIRATVVAPARVPRTGTWRRPLAAVSAAALVVAILVGIGFSTSPGGPLYDARLWFESANLSSRPVARAEAEVARLQRRIDEARDASNGGDPSAAAAALRAYSTIVTTTGDETRADPAAARIVVISLTRHVVVLGDLAETVQPGAQVAASDALQSCTMTLDELSQP
jgi:hypothetical protein